MSSLALLDPARALRALNDRSTVVVVAPTGSGKSTALCAAIAKTFGNTIVCEPRRVAARSLAAFVSDQEGQTIGEFAGYVVRFDNMTRANTPLTYVTTGVLLKMFSGNPSLSGISVVVLDEFHERALEMDAILAVLKRLQKTCRPDLRVVVTSATLEIPHLLNFLENAAVVDYGAAAVHETPDGEQVFNGRFAVEIKYLSSGSLSEALSCIENHELGQGKDEKGAVLIFQPGKAEIDDCMNVVKARWSDAEVIPLHSELADEEQDKIFAPVARGKRKVVVATNIAETSITVPDATYVIDSGLEKVAYYHPNTRSTQLALEKISRASAIQRAGRAGRTGPGVVFRLWSKEDHVNLQAARVPAILRQELTSVLLALKDAGLDLDELDLLDRASPAQVTSARQTLYWLDALDREGKITELGRKLARLPIEPRLGRAVLALDERRRTDALPLLLRVVSAMTAGRPFVSLHKRDPEHSQMANAHALLRSRFAGFKSDLVTHAAIISMYEKDRTSAKKHFLRAKVLEESLIVENKMADLLGLRARPAPPEEWSPELVSIVRYALFKGYPDNTFLLSARAYDKTRYSPVIEPFTQEIYVLDYESALHISAPVAVIAANVRATQKLKILNNLSAVDVDWLGELPNVRVSWDIAHEYVGLVRKIKLELPNKGVREHASRPDQAVDVARAIIDLLFIQRESAVMKALRVSEEAMSDIEQIGQKLAEKPPQVVQEAIRNLLREIPDLKNDLGFLRSRVEVIKNAVRDACGMSENMGTVPRLSSSSECREKRWDALSLG